jgi:prepilin signal peptidase PulO-like enzyme (type II secretory pathway)
MPYAWPFLILLALQAATIAVVRDPGSLPGIRRHPLVGLLPLLGIGGMVIVLGAWPGAVDAVTALAAIAVPILALLAGLHVRRWAVPIALAAPLLWLVAWRFDGSQWADLAGDILIVLAAAMLGRLTGWVAPRWALVIGVFVATGVDIWQVARIEVQPVAQALGVAEPPSGLPSLQELRFRGATMGWGDAYLAAVAGAIVAVSRRATVAAVLACGIGGAAFALLFLVVDYLPATVPVAFALLVAGLVERRAVASALRSRPWAGR